MPKLLRPSHFEGITVGVDEAGRGPLAGPVVAAACYVPHDVFLRGVNDSKQLSPLQRGRILSKVEADPRIMYAVAAVDSTVIDEINILQATHRAMREAVAALREAMLAIGILLNKALVDGRPVPDLGCPHEAFVQGDGRVYSIALASIIAKEKRDALMKAYPDQRWKFHQHKGYGTEEHFRLIKKFGISPIHRKTFIEEQWQPPQLSL